MHRVKEIYLNLSDVARKSIFSIATFLMIFSCFVAILLAIAIHRPNNLSKSTILLLKPGYTTYKIASLLEENKVIPDKWLFILYAKIIHRNKKLIAGEYEFFPKQTMKNIIHIIEKGESLVRRITIPEGYTSWQIIKLLEAEERLSGNIKNVPAEGSLFPDTYFFKYGDLRSKIVSSMEEKMSDRLSKLQTQLPKKGYINTIEKLVILASIIEKEAGSHAEKPIISSVFHNRLKRQMKLQADPTVIYAITKGEALLGRNLTKKDLAYKSPYNTYINSGLPPSPIACPGFKSLEAALHPASTNYLYFVADGNGGHNFSAKLEEHNINVAEYRKKLKEQVIPSPKQTATEEQGTN